MFQLAPSRRRGHITGFGGPGVFHCFSTRIGGVSGGPYASLNVGFASGDDPQKVRANRERLFADIGWSLDDAVFGRQVHGTRIVAVDASHRGRGARDTADAFPGTDGFVTDVPGVALAVLGADCAPVYFFDRRRRAIGLVHAGWRGTAAGIAREALAAMKDAFGTAPEDVEAAIGPAIGACCYQVGEEVADAYRRAGLDSALAPWPGEPGRWRLDLAGALREQLVGEGVPPSHIHEAAVCTCCRDDLFFSHRRAGRPAGRMAAVFVLQDG